MGQRPRGPVLVVEDNAETREVLVRVLNVRGYETATADDGLDALGYLHSGGMPSVIILDMRMPNMDGYAFQRALKADERWTNIPIIIYTAVPAEHAGDVFGVLRKGTANPEMLLGLVARALSADDEAQADD